MATDEIVEYAAAVRAALEDIPADDRAELLDDLDDHLAEVAAESSVPLTERLGPPEAYAAELRAAYGAGAAGSGRSRWVAIGRAPVALHRRMLGSSAYREVVAFLPELRPGWWVVRGLVAAMLIWGIIGWHILPHNPVELVTALLPIWLSVLIGRRVRNGQPRTGWRALLVMVNVAGAIVAIAIFASLQGQYDNRGATTVAPVSASVTSDTTNIFPYSKDGKPLHDILLYDQNGQPLLSSYSEDGEQLIQPCNGPPPLANSYPLPLEPIPDGSDPNGDQQQPWAPLSPDGGPSPCSSVSPSPSTPVSPNPSVSASPSGSPTPAPRPSGSPSPSH